MKIDPAACVHDVLVCCVRMKFGDLKTERISCDTAPEKYVQKFLPFFLLSRAIGGSNASGKA